MAMFNFHFLVWIELSISKWRVYEILEFLFFKYRWYYYFVLFIPKFYTV